MVRESHRGPWAGDNHGRENMITFASNEFGTSVHSSGSEVTPWARTNTPEQKLLSYSESVIDANVMVPIRIGVSTANGEAATSFDVPPSISVVKRLLHSR